MDIALSIFLGGLMIFSAITGSIYHASGKGEAPKDWLGYAKAGLMGRNPMKEEKKLLPTLKKLFVKVLFLPSKIWGLIPKMPRWLAKFLCIPTWIIVLAIWLQ